MVSNVQGNSKGGILLAFGNVVCNSKVGADDVLHNYAEDGKCRG